MKEEFNRNKGYISTRNERIERRNETKHKQKENR